MATQVHVFAGTYTIGGNVISVTSGSDRVIFDFGSAYSPADDPYDGVVLHRNRSWVRDAIRLNKIPEIDGVFSRKDLGDWRHIQAAEESDLNTAVLISHLHLDHMACMGMVASSIPVYMHPTVRKLELALDVIGESVRREGRSYSTLEPGQPLQVGSIEVFSIITDGSQQGTLGFYIKTPDGTLYWPADVVLHGLHSELVWESMRWVKKRGVDVLFCDATSFMDDVMNNIYGDPNAPVVGSSELPAGMLTVGEVMEEARQAAFNHVGLTVFNTYTRDSEYALLMLDCAKESGKIAAFEPEKAYVLSEMFGISPAIYMPDYRRYDTYNEPEWLKELLASCPLVTTEDIRREPGRYVVENSYRHLMELFDLQGLNGIYLHLDGVPLGAFDPAYAKLLKVVELAGFRYLNFGVRDNYFSHAYPNQVQYYVEQINPRVLVPCHSFNPERLQPGSNGVQLLPVEGQIYLLEKGVLRNGTEQ